MATYYPTLIKTFTNRTDFTDTILAEHVNSLQNEVTAIETTLGTYLTTGSGWVGSWDKSTTSWSSLKDRIANIEYGLGAVGDAILPTGGTTGQFLVKTSSSNYAASWQTVNALPTQTGQNGKYLTTDGSSASWAVLEAPISALLLIGA